MTYKTLRKILNWSLYWSLCGFFLSGFFCLGASSVSIYFWDSLAEIRQIEDKGLLNNLPENISFPAKDAIEFLGNSQEIETYVRSVEKDFFTFLFVCVAFLFLCVLCLGLRVWFRKNKFPDEAKVCWPFKSHL